MKYTHLWSHRATKMLSIHMHFAHYVRPIGSHIQHISGCSFRISPCHSISWRATKKRERQTRRKKNFLFERECVSSPPHKHWAYRGCKLWTLYGPVYHSIVYNGSGNAHCVRSPSTASDFRSPHSTPIVSCHLHFISVQQHFSWSNFPRTRAQIAILLTFFVFFLFYLVSRLISIVFSLHTVLSQ